MSEKVKFIEIVSAMRKAQKAYFSYHRGSDLIKAKKLEAKVDEAIFIWRNGECKQGELFK